MKSDIEFNVALQISKTHNTLLFFEYSYPDLHNIPYMICSKHSGNMSVKDVKKKYPSM